MNKNIWIVSKYACPSKYGSPTRHFLFAKEFNKHGYDTLIISSNSNHTAKLPVFDEKFKVEIIDDVKTIWVNTLKYVGSNSIKRILSWIDFEWKLFQLNKNTLVKPDIVIVSSLSLLTIISGIRFKRKYKSRFILEIRDIWPLTIIQLGNYRKWNPFVLLLSWIERIGYKQADVIVGTMPNLSEHVKNIIGENGKCYFIPQGLDTSLYDFKDTLDYDLFDNIIPTNKFIIGYAGSIGHSNALETLIDCAFLLHADKKIHFVVIGDGDLLDNIKEQTKNLKNITFIPKVARQKIQMLLTKCNILYDSVRKIGLYQYGLSRNKWIDYMYAGKPIIASFKGYKSMINEANCGTFIEPENTKALVETIIKYSRMDKKRLLIIGENGKNWLIQNRNFSTLAKHYIELFSKP